METGRQTARWRGFGLLNLIQVYASIESTDRSVAVSGRV
jgi:hypothetical protein